VSCEKDKDTELDGKWQLKEVMDIDGVVHPVDTVWYDFQNTLFRYQYYDTAEKQYHWTHGLKTKEGEDRFRIELLPYAIPVDSFILFTDWKSGVRSFTVEKKTRTSLVLSSEGKEYRFKDF